MDSYESQYSDDILEAVDAGRKIEAIKLLRDDTGLGLKEAKDQIDRLARKRHPNGDPHAMTEQGGAGGLIKLAVLVVAVLAVYRYFFAG